MTKKPTTKAEEITASEKVDTKADQTVKVPESTYPISEFVENAEKFDTDKIVVKTALDLAKKTEYTLDEAKKIIEEFKNKEV